MGMRATPRALVRRHLRSARDGQVEGTNRFLKRLRRQTALSSVLIASCAVVSAQTPGDRGSIQRLSEATVRAVAAEAVSADGDVKAFQREFAARLAKLSPGSNYQILPLVVGSAATKLSVGAYGPISGFYVSASDLVRKMAPITGAVWTEGITVFVIPLTTGAPNVERVIVLRDGKMISAVSGSLRPVELGGRTGETATLNGGRLVYPLSAFDPGADVRIELFLADRDPIVTKLSRSDIAMLR